MTTHPTADLARFCAQLHYEDLSASVRERVRYLLLDHLAVTLRGSILPSSLAGYQMLESNGYRKRSWSHYFREERTG